MTLADRVAQWPEQWRREGVAEGRREGRREAVAGQRALLRRFAASRFGDAVGERLERLLADTEDWERLSAAAELIVTAQNEADLIDAVSDIVRRPG